MTDELLFGAVADEFLAFIGDASLAAHNAGFDIASINAEGSAWPTRRNSPVYGARTNPANGCPNGQAKTPSISQAA